MKKTAFFAAMLVAIIFLGSCTKRAVTPIPNGRYWLASGSDYMIVTVAGASGSILYQGQTYSTQGQYVSCPDGLSLGKVLLTDYGGIMRLQSADMGTVHVFGPSTYVEE